MKAYRSSLEEAADPRKARAAASVGWIGLTVGELTVLLSIPTSTPDLSASTSLQHKQKSCAFEKKFEFKNSRLPNARAAIAASRRKDTSWKLSLRSPAMALSIFIAAA